MLKSILEKLSVKIPEGAKRSPGWRSIERAHLKIYPECSACGSTRKLEVHHVQPFHLHPELELTPSNLITLCRRCHFLFGHHDHWQKINPCVRGDSDEQLRRMRG